MTLRVRPSSSLAKLPPRIVDKKHVAFLHQLPCVLCGALEVHVHHLRRASSRRGQYKSGDDACLPLCPLHHNMGDQSLHGQEGEGVKEAQYFRLHGLADPYGLAPALYEHSGDYVACVRLIEESRASSAPLANQSATPLSGEDQNNGDEG